MILRSCLILHASSAAKAAPDMCRVSAICMEAVGDLRNVKVSVGEPDIKESGEIKHPNDRLTIEPLCRLV